MKKFYLLFLLLYMLITTSNIAAQTAVYFEENFDKYSTIPTGWTLSGTVLSSYYNWSVFSGTTLMPVHSGTRCLRADSYNNLQGSTSIITTPEITITNSYTNLSFWIKNVGGGNVSVYVSKDGGLTYLNDQLADNLTHITDWTKKTYSLSAYNGETIKIVFYAVSNHNTCNDGYQFIDDVKVYEVPTCAQPVDLRVEDIKKDEATFNWAIDDEGDPTNTYLINVYDNTNNYILQNQTITTTDNRYTITGLSANTTYNVTLQANCNAAQRGLSNVSQTLTMTTLCESEGIPYTQNFDSETLYTLPSCWNGVIESSCYARVSDSYSYNNSGKSLQLSSTTNYKVYVTTMPISHAGNDLQVDFKMYVPSYTNVPVYAGLINNPLDFSTFELLFEDTIDAPYTWINYRFNTSMSNYGTEENLMVCFVIPSGGSYNAYLEDVNITAIPTCPRLENLVATEIDSTSFKLSWSDPTATPSGNYLIELVRLSDNDTTYVTSTTKPAVIGNGSAPLLPQTEYSVRVLQICSATNSSEWSTALKVKTKCGVFELPYTELFNQYTFPECWQTSCHEVGPGTSGSVFDGWQINTSSIYAHTSYSVTARLSRAGTRYLLCSPALLIPSDDTYELNFWMYRFNYDTNSGERVNIYVNNRPTLEGATKIDSINKSVKFYPIEAELKSKAYQYFYDIPITGVVYILFESVHFGDGAMYIDDVTVAPKITCRNGISKVDIRLDKAQNKANISWMTRSPETQWAVDITLSDASNNILNENNNIVNTTSFVYDYTQYVTPNSTYTLKVKVRGYCSENDTAIAEAINTKTLNFTTPCEPTSTLLIFEGFEGPAFPSPCWSMSTDPNSASPTYSWSKTTYSTYANTGVGAISYGPVTNKTIGYLNSPSILFNQGNEYQVTFSIYRTHMTATKYAEGITVWLGTTPDDTTNATKLIFIPRETELSPAVEAPGYYTYTQEFTVPTTGSYYIILQATQEYGAVIRLDDIIIEHKPTCTNLPWGTVNLEPEATFVEVTVNDPDVSWLEVAVCDNNAFSFDSIMPSDIFYTSKLSVLNRTFRVEGLQPSTEYNLFYRNICDSLNNVKSTWSFNPITFKTRCAPVDVLGENELVESFEEFNANVTLTDENTCFHIFDKNATNHTLTIKGALGSSIYSSGTQCVPVDGSKQVAIMSGSDGKFSELAHLHAGITYEVSVFARTDKAYTDVAEISLFYMSSMETKPIYLAEHLDANSGSWVKYKAYLTVPTDGNYFVGFEYYQKTSTTYFAFDYFRTREVQCAPPTSFNVNSITDNSINISTTGTADAYEIRICTEEPSVNDPNPAAVYLDTVNTNTFTISNLSPNTTYYCIMRGLCNGEPSDWLNPFEFATQCVEYNLPYTTSFETDNELQCWRTLGKLTNKISSSSAFASEGAKSLAVTNASAISPKINTTALGNCIISGMVYSSSSTASTIDVGVIVDPYDPSTSEIISSITIPGQQWVEFSTLFEALNNDPDYEDFIDAKHIMITCPATGNYYFDELIIAPKPTCLKPSNVTATVIDAYNAEVKWDGNNEETDWIVTVYKQENNSLTYVYDTIAHTDSITLSNLTPITNYKFGVNALCTTADTSWTAYSNIVKTPCGSMPLPFISQFGNTQPECWETYNSKNTSTSCGWSFSTYALCWQYYPSYYATDSCYLETPSFKLNTNNGVFLRIDGTTSASTRIRYTLDNWLTFDSVEIVNTSYSRNTQELFIPNVGPGNISFQFFFKAKSSGNILIYGIEVEEAESCTRPDNAQFYANGDSVSVTIFDDDTTHTEWEYVLDNKEFDPDSKTPTTVNSKTFVIHDLFYTSTYNVYIRTKCGNDHSSWYKPYTFKTPCGITHAPYNEDFNNLTNKNQIINECYTYYSENPNNRNGQMTGTANYPYITLFQNNNYGVDQSKAIGIVSSNSYAMYMYLPEFTKVVNNYVVSFYYTNQNTNSENPHIQVGVMLPDNPESFVKAYDCPVKAGNIKDNNVIVDLYNTLPANDYTGYRIAFRYGTSVYNYTSSIDNIQVVEKEKCVEVPTLKLLSHTTESITLINAFVADSVQIKYAMAGATNVIDSIVKTEALTTIGGLTSGTIYDFYIRNICNMAGEWAGPISISTKCEAITIDDTHPYVENFDNLPSENALLSTCITTATTATINTIEYPRIVNAEMITAPSALEMNGNNTIVLPAFNGNPNEYWISVYSKGTGTLSIGTTDNIDPKTFETDTIITLNQDLTKYDIDLTYYTNSGNRISLRSTANTQLYIDSICVYKKETCFTPRRLTISEITDIEAKAKFLLSSITEKYEYVLTSANDTVTDIINANDTTLMLTDLAANTLYTFAIRTICSDGDTSAWATANFRTSRKLARAPYEITFEDENINDIVYFANATNNRFIIGTDSSAIFGGDKSLYITYDGTHYGYGRITSYSYAIIPVKFTHGKYTISYNWYCVGSVYNDYARVFLAPENLSFTGNQQVSGIGSNALPAGCISLDNNNQLYGSTHWERKETVLDFTEDVNMNMVIYWRNMSYGTGTIPVAIDNISINKYSCAESIDSIKVNYVSAHDITMQIYPNPALEDSVRYEVTDLDLNVITSGVAVLDSITHRLVIDGLESETTYNYAIAGYCSKDITISTQGTFTTKCEAIVVNDTTPYFEGFESCSTSTTFKSAFPCWTYQSVYGMTDLISLSENPVGVGEIAYDGSQAMKLYYNNAKEISRNFILAEGNYEFSLFAVQTIGQGNVSISVRKAGDVEWTNLTTKDITLSYEPIVGTFTVDKEWEYEVKVNINAKEVSSGYLAIDNISLQITDVARPTIIRVNNVTKTSADVTWEGTSESHIINIINLDNDTLVFNTTVTDTSNIRIQNLVPGTTYMVSIKGTNDLHLESDSITGIFSTLCNSFSYYVDDFEDYEVNIRPLCWEEQSFTSNNDEYHMAKGYLQWEVGEVGGHKGLFCQNSEAVNRSVHNLYSPEVVIEDGQWLSFEYFNNIDYNYHPDSLVVTIIHNDTETSPILTATYRETGSGWKQFFYDMSAYAGDTVKVKFSTRASSYSTFKYVGIDNFRLNCRVDGSEINVAVCPQESYSGYGFEIPTSQLTIGKTNTFYRYAEISEGCDTLYTLNVYVPSNALVVIYDTICEGEVYNKGMWSNLTEAKHYQNTFTSSFGCDSTVSLYLSIIELNVNKELSICEGENYQFGGSTLTESGVYTDTTINSRGCDSITTLTLHVIPKYYETTAYFCEGTTYTWNQNRYTTAGRYEVIFSNINGCDSIEVLNLNMLPTNTMLTATICEGQEYEFFGEIITEAGTYTHRLANSLGCDSIIILTTTVVPAPKFEVSDYVCEGQEYYGYGFALERVSQDTVLSRIVKTIEGCDSIVEVTLDFMPTQYTTIDVTIEEGETYEFGGNTYSQAGTYTGNFYTSYGCDSIVTLNLDVTTGTENTYTLPIIVSPNPIFGGQSTFISKEWTAEEQNGMRVEALNSIGQVIDIFAPSTYPIEINGLRVSGIYYIRITSGIGDVYIGRLVVK
ncbi:MAG: fibronectin type III domain-containing protein [Candidatus Aphodosoma sp.]